MEPIFTEAFLSHYLPDFPIYSITDIRGISRLIEKLSEELESGKLESQKEEEIKSRYIQTFFGVILGFNNTGLNEWQIREEKKSSTDGTKADAALGYFYSEKEHDIVKAIIEIKDANTDLDKNQNNRVNKQSPVDQAFSYVHKMKGTCDWVIVSNMKEIRFYRANDGTKAQVFFLKDLINEGTRNELLFLFHKDRFIKKSAVSQTDMLFEKSKAFIGEQDKPVHIIDKIFNCLKRFRNFGFVDPEFISTIQPFNILDDHVWHYNNRELFTINAEIYHLLYNVSIENNNVVFTNELKKEIEVSNVIDANNKLKEIFIFLNRCLIFQISAVKDYHEIKEKNKNTIGFGIRHRFPFQEGDEGITKSIFIQKEKCTCTSCCFRTFDFNKFLSNLKVASGNETFDNLNFAFGNYLAASNNFKTCFNILKAIEKRTKGQHGSEIEYFRSKQNLQLLHNLILDYDYADSKEILKEIKAVDLDKVIYNEIEFNVDKEVTKYLLKVKEDEFVYKLQDRIIEANCSINEIAKTYDDDHDKYRLISLSNNLFYNYHSLYSYINANFIIYDSFTPYKSLTKKIFKGIVTSLHLTRNVGIVNFDYLLTEAIIHIHPSDLQKILKGIELFEIDKDVSNSIIEKLYNFTKSYYIDLRFGDSPNALFKEHLINFSFRERFRCIFTNIFTILCRLEISKEQFLLVKTPLLKFLKTETELTWDNLQEFALFLTKKGNLFEPSELLEILKIAIEGDKYGFNKYIELIIKTSQSLFIYYPEYQISYTKLIRLAVINCVSDNEKNSNYRHLIPLIRVCDSNCKRILLDTFESLLDKDFDSNLYELLIEEANYNWSSKNYFKIYSEQVNKLKGGRAFKYGKKKLTDGIFMSYANLIYFFNIDFGREELKLLTNLNNFESWLLNPLGFDYTNFDAKWLTEINDPLFLERIINIDNVRIGLNNELDKSFDPILAEIKFSYFKSTN